MRLINFQKAKRIIIFLFSIGDAYRAFYQKRERDLEIEELRQQFNNVGFFRLPDNINGDALFDIGTAIRLARYYNIDLWGGLGFSDCRAVLERENWKSQKITGPLLYRWAADEDPNEVRSLVAFGTTINEAICKCLIAAKVAGII